MDRITVRKEVTINLGNYENVKLMAEVGRDGGTETKKALSDMADLVNEALAYEAEVVGADPKKYGLK